MPISGPQDYRHDWPIKLIIINNYTQNSCAKHATCRLSMLITNLKIEITLPTTYANRKSNVSIVHACNGGVVGDELQEH